MATFADGLTDIIAQKRRETGDRAKIAAKWKAHEGTLIDIAVDKFKNRCMKEAESQKCSATISFEVLTREIPNFPKHLVKDGSYIVDSWGDAAASWWFYSSRGTAQEYNSANPILFAEVLESMMARFLEQVKTLGFDSCKREPGTWKVTSSWSLPGSEERAKDEPASKKSKRSRSREGKHTGNAAPAPRILAQAICRLSTSAAPEVPQARL